MTAFGLFVIVGGFLSIEVILNNHEADPIQGTADNSGAEKDSKSAFQALHDQLFGFGISNKDYGVR